MPVELELAKEHHFLEVTASMNWTDTQREQFKSLLKTVPSEDVAIVTAHAWCRELGLKFDADDENVARRWHRYFHTGSLEASAGKLYLYVKDSRGSWLPVKCMSTRGLSIWTCLDRNDSFMKFDAANPGCRSMAKSYADAAKQHGGIEVKVIEA